MSLGKCVGLDPIDPAEKTSLKIDVSSWFHLPLSQKPQFVGLYEGSSR